MASFGKLRQLLNLQKEQEESGYIQPEPSRSGYETMVPAAQTALENTPSALSKAGIAAFKMSSPMAYALDTAGNPQARGNVLEQIDPSHAAGMADSSILKFLRVNPEEFVNATKTAIEKRPLIKDFITQYEPKDLRDSKLFLTSDKASGLAVKPDADISSVFSLETGRGNPLVKKALSEGGKKLDAFEGYLTNELYPKHGFMEYNRTPNWNMGEPDVVYMGQPDYLKDLIKSGKLPESPKDLEMMAKFLALRKKLGL